MPYNQLNWLKRSLARTFPNQFLTVRYWRLYRHAARIMGNHLDERNRLFAQMVAESAGKPAMQVGVRDAKYAPHWVSVDLYDTSPLIDYHYDIHNLQFEAGRFEYVACLAVLEHVEDPLKAIAEMHRVLKPGGKIWVEVPFNQPYHPSPGDYWRVSPDGMRLWMKDFQEIALGTYALAHSAIYNGIYFYGTKV